MSWELLHLADGKVSVRRDGRELGIMEPPALTILHDCPDCGLQEAREIADTRPWTTRMEHLLNQADQAVQARQGRI